MKGLLIFLGFNRSSLVSSIEGENPSINIKISLKIRLDFPRIYH